MRRSGSWPSPWQRLIRWPRPRRLFGPIVLPDASDFAGVARYGTRLRIRQGDFPPWAARTFWEVQRPRSFSRQRRSEAARVPMSRNCTNATMSALNTYPREPSVTGRPKSAARALTGSGNSEDMRNILSAYSSGWQIVSRRRDTAPVRRTFRRDGRCRSTCCRRWSSWAIDLLRHGHRVAVGGIPVGDAYDHRGIRIRILAPSTPRWPSMRRLTLRTSGVP